MCKWVQQTKIDLPLIIKIDNGKTHNWPCSSRCTVIALFAIPQVATGQHLRQGFFFLFPTQWRLSIQDPLDLSLALTCISESRVPVEQASADLASGLCNSLPPRVSSSNSCKSKRHFYWCSFSPFYSPPSTMCAYLPLKFLPAYFHLYFVALGCFRRRPYSLRHLMFNLASGTWQTQYTFIHP